MIIYLPSWLFVQTLLKCKSLDRFYIETDFSQIDKRISHFSFLICLKTNINTKTKWIYSPPSSRNTLKPLFLQPFAYSFPFWESSRKMPTLFTPSFTLPFNSPFPISLRINITTKQNEIFSLLPRGKCLCYEADFHSPIYLSISHFA